MKSFFLIFAIVIFSLDVPAQQIKLTNNKTKKELLIKKGMRVSYVLKKHKTKAVIGILNEVTSTSITVDTTTVAIEDLARFGRRKKGVGFGTFALAAVGGGMIGSVVFAGNSDPCPQCQTVSVEDDGFGALSNIIAVAGGVTLIGLAINTGVKNSPRNLTVWDLEVIN